MREDDLGMTDQDNRDHQRAFETVEIQTRDGKIILGFGREVMLDGEEDATKNRHPVRMMFTYGQAQALTKALGLGMAALRRERAGRRDGA